MKKPMIEKKMKSKLMAMGMAVTMVFAMAPLGGGVAFADEELTDPQDVTVEEPQDEAVDEAEAAAEEVVADEQEVVAEEEEAAAEEPEAMEAIEAEAPQKAAEDEVAAAEEDVTALATAKTIKTSEITDDMLVFRGEKGYLRVGQDFTLYIDKDITLHGITADDREYNKDTGWSGSYYDLTIKGDGTHTLTILADINAVDAINANNVTFESGNVEIIKLDPVNSIKAQNEFRMKGGKLRANIIKTGWANFSVDGKLTVSGGELTVLDNDETGQTRGAIECGSFEMTGGIVRGECYYMNGIWSYGTTTISGGKITANGGSAGLETDGQFKMTGGYIYATSKEDYAFTPAIDFGKNKPVLGGCITITNPAKGKVAQYDNYGNPWYTADKDGNVAKAAVLQPAFSKTAASLSTKAYTYNGKAKTPAVTVKDGNKILKKGTDYTVTYDSGRIKAGTYKVKVTGKGFYTNETKTLTFKINKAANTLKIKAKTGTVKYKYLKKKTQYLGVTKLITFTSKGQGSKTYVKTSGNKKITVNKTSGKLTVKKGLKKGSYKVTIKVTAAGSANYNKVTKSVTVTVKVK